ncbi:MAG: D-alanine--D-alanine ligase, partial [Colwellia sp.]
MTVLNSQKLAVLYGGDSAEREVSLNSGKAVAEGLRQAGFEVELIDTKGFCLTDLTKRNIDRVFIALHG